MKAVAHHFAFEVRDLDQALPFYVDALGMDLKFRHADASHNESFAFLSYEGGSLELLQVLDGSGHGAVAADEAHRHARQFHPPYCPHLALAVANVEGAMAELLAKGAAPVAGPLDNGAGVRWAYLADADGNVIELLEGM